MQGFLGKCKHENWRPAPVFELLHRVAAVELSGRGAVVECDPAAVGCDRDCLSQGPQSALLFGYDCLPQFAFARVHVDLINVDARRAGRLHKHVL